MRMGVTAEDYACPVCGIALIASDLDLPEGEYFCPYCCTELRPRPRSVPAPSV